MAKKERSEYRCRDCMFATDYHEIGAKGVPFLCKCKFHTRSMFLNLDWCDNFKKKV